MRKESGFTLAELMLCIGIVAILASIAVPNFVSWLPKRRLQSAASQVQSAIQLARMAAIKENASVVMTFNPATNRYTVFIDNGAGANWSNGVQDADESTLRNNAIHAEIDMTAADFGGNPFFAFDSKGLANESGTVALKNRLNQTRTITLTLTGGTRIQ